MVRALEEVSLLEVRNERQIGAQQESLAVFTSVRALSAGTGVLSVGTRAQKPSSAVVNDEYYESDTGFRYRYSGTAWLYSSGVAIGTNATRAAITVTANDNGALFYTTDTKLLWRVTAGAWAQADITPAAHKDLHKSGGADAFTSSDLLEAIVKRIQESAGPTTLTVGAVADGEFLKRVGSTVVGAAAGGTAIDNAAAQSVLGATFSITGATGVFQDTGLSVTLPSAGTYLVQADVRFVMSFSAGANLFLVAKFFNSTDAADVANSERLLNYSDVVTSLRQGTAPVTAVIVVAASKVIKLYAARVFGGTVVASDIASNADGRTRLSYLKVA